MRPVDVNSQLAAQVSFVDFVEEFQFSGGKAHAFLEIYDDQSIELKIMKGIYENQNALFITFVDCSLAQKLEKAKSENRYKTLIMSTVGHELRTPVNAVLGSLEAITPYIPPEGQTYIEIAKNSCHMLSYQINDLTDYGKVSDAKLVLSKMNIDVEEIITECISIASWQAKSKKLEVKYFKSTKPIKNISNDPRRLKQVLLNLLSNAIKFTQKGGVKVKAKQSEDGIKISVKDTGMGIKEEDMPKLFKEFEMLESHRIMNPNGTGLGLYLCKRILGEMKGSISVKSVYEKGSKFTIHLPVSVGVEELNNTINNNGSDSTNRELIPIHYVEKKGCKCTQILVADDNDTNIMVMQTLLKKFELECDTARNGSEAVKAVEQRKETNTCCKDYKLVVLDYYMPVMSGLEAASKLKEMLTTSKVIALTGENVEDVLEHTGRTFDEVLCKPISIKKVEEILKTYGVIKK